MSGFLNLSFSKKNTSRLLECSSYDRLSGLLSFWLSSSGCTLVGQYYYAKNRMKCFEILQVGLISLEKEKVLLIMIHFFLYRINEMYHNLCYPLPKEL